MPTAFKRSGVTRTVTRDEMSGGSGWRAHTPPRPRRRPALMVGGLAVAALATLVSLWRISTLTHRESVLVVVRAVAVGSVIQDADLGVAGLPVTSDLVHVPAARRPDVVGKLASSDLVAGSLLAPGQVGEVVPPGKGQALTVLALPASRVPAIGLRPGDSILVVSTPAAQGDLPQTRPDSIAAHVVRVGSADVNGLVPVDVVVSTFDGPELAARAATGRIAVVVQSRVAG